MINVEIVYEKENDWFVLYRNGSKLSPLVTHINDAYILRASLDKAIREHDDRTNDI